MLIVSNSQCRSTGLQQKVLALSLALKPLWSSPWPGPWRPSPWPWPWGLSAWPWRLGPC